MYAVLDIGGTNMRVVVTKSLNNPTFTDIRKLPITDNYVADLQSIVSAIKELSSDEPMRGIGLSVAGDINTNDGYINAVDYFKDWIKKPLASDLSREFNCPVKIQNDAVAAGHGEAVYGQGKGRDFLFLIWGSGFGGTEIKTVHGRDVVSPFDPGHQIIHQNGRTCVCGQKGCLQAYVGGKETSAIYGTSAAELSDADWRQILEDVAQGLMNLVAIRPTRLIVFGGGGRY